MATYAELTEAYQNLESGSGDKWRFQQAHPKWWDRYRAEKTTAAEATPPETAPSTQAPSASPEPVVHQYPDGSFLTVYPDGRRVLTYPDGSTKELAPGQSITDPTLADPTRARPPKPPVPPVLAKDGWDYIWDEDSEAWVLTQSTKPPQAFNNDLYAQYKKTLETYGLSPTDAFLRQAVLEDWSEDTFYLRMIEQDWYLANPLFRANLERGRQGKRVMSELEVLSFAEQAKEMARRYGYQEPPDSYLALSLTTKGDTTKSLAEMESKIIAWQRLEAFGEPIKAYAEQALRVNLSDKDLFEFFDPDITDPEWVRAFKYAEYRGRPILLGFEGRSQEEARAYEMLGYTPDQVNELFRTAQGTKATTSRLASIEADLLAGMDPERIREVLKGHEDLVVQADVLQLPEARRRLQELLLRERARWRTSGSPVGQQGVLHGLLSPTERASFG